MVVYLLLFFQAGAAAGGTVEMALFPLDTLKTRFQSHSGFWKAGGVRNIYSGIASAAVASAPTGDSFRISRNSNLHSWSALARTTVRSECRYSVAAGRAHVACHVDHVRVEA